LIISRLYCGLSETSFSETLRATKQNKKESLATIAKHFSCVFKWGSSRFMVGSGE
jgi:hypothetical protein